MKTRQIAVICVFCAVIFGLCALHLLIGDSELSISERRRLAQAPAADISSIMSGDFSDDLETYMLDQFPARDAWRGTKAALRLGLFFQSDNNGLYMQNGTLAMTGDPLKEKQVLYCAKKINELSAGFPEDCNVFYSVIPDKNYYAARGTSRPETGLALMLGLLRQNIDGSVKYIDITGALSLEDYYLTDPHWSQERILPAAQTLCHSMGVQAPEPSDFTAHELYPFSGLYAGRYALSVPPETMKYLTSAATGSAAVSSIETGDIKMYDPGKLSGTDGYDVFLGGAQAIVHIKAAVPKSGRRLVIFRDSFGSALAPLLTGSYDEITLVDLRYIKSELIPNYVDLNGSDVLFLYGEQLVNSAMLLK